MKENGDYKERNRNRLRELRHECNLSQMEIAKGLGVFTKTYANWENGTRQMNYDMLKATAKLFHVSIDYILYNSDAPVPVVESNVQNKYTELLEEGFHAYCGLYLMMTSEQREEAISMLNKYMDEQYKEHKREEDEENAKQIHTEKAASDRMTCFMLTDENNKRAGNGMGTRDSCNYIRIPITLYLKAYGLSIKDVAHEIGITSSAVYAIGVKCPPSVATCGKLAGAMTNLGVPKTTIDVMNDLYRAPETLSTK